MLNSPTAAIQTNSQTPENVEQPTPSTESQHGLQDEFCLLLDIPAEILTGVTSHLTPASLCNLALVNRRLHEHVKDDSTWHSAFVQQFLGIDFQSELYNRNKRLMLRRESRSWREEFTKRFGICKKWMHSRNTTTRHIPVHSVISSMHLMPGHSALLSASNFYGIVSRSLPLTGRILPGYINPTGPRLGIGLGNPNVEFAPNVTTCILASDGGTAKVLWGIRNGEVTLTTAPKAINMSRQGVNFNLVRCHANEEHEGPVLNAAWDGEDFAITGGADGRIKLWDTRTMRCLWTSEQVHRSLVPEAFVLVASSLKQGIIAGCLKNGDIVVYDGFQQRLTPEHQTTVDTSNVRTATIVRPAEYGSGSREDKDRSCHASYFSVDTSSCTGTILLVAYQGDTNFYKVILQYDQEGSSKSHAIAFGDHAFGPISCLAPFFANSSTQSSFILVGDFMGQVYVYDWHIVDAENETDSRSTAPISPLYRFEAHLDGSAITTLQWNGIILATGAANGVTQVFNGLTFAPIRSFASPTPRFRGRAHLPPVDPSDDGRVRQILCSPDHEVIVVNVGNAILAWKAGPLGKAKSGGVRGRVPLDGQIQSKKRNHGAKWLQQVELKQNIAESQQLLKQEGESRKAHNKAKEKTSTLDSNSLGLNEEEALEYALMLSREVHEKSPTSATDCTADQPYSFTDADALTDRELSSALEQGGFHWGAEGASDVGHANDSASSDVIPLSASSSNSSNYGHNTHWNQASDPFTRVLTITPNDHISEFPPIDSHPTFTSSPGLHPARTIGSGPGPSTTSAWGRALKTSATVDTSNAGGRSLLSPSPSTPHASPTQSSNPDDDMDEDLRFALELSLAEANSCMQP